MTLQHYKLRSRFCADGQLVTEGYLAVGIKNLQWAVKMLVLNKALK
jgi:hypothetical protein